MSNHGTTQSNLSDPLTQTEVKGFRALLLSCGDSLLQYPAVVRRLLKSSTTLDQVLGTLIPSADLHAPARQQWQEFYKKFFGLTIDFSTVVIPAQQEGFTRLIIVAQGITFNATMAACKKHFHCLQYYDELEKSITHNDRIADCGAYAVWFRDRIEADEEMANISAKDLRKSGTKGITLLERVLMELDYFGRTGQHLDLRTWTLCAGSRLAGSSVPGCRWRGEEFNVHWASLDDCYPDLRARVAVF